MTLLLTRTSAIRLTSSSIVSQPRPPYDVIYSLVPRSTSCPSSLYRTLQYCTHTLPDHMSITWHLFFSYAISFLTALSLLMVTCMAHSSFS